MNTGKNRRICMLHFRTPVDLQLHYSNLMLQSKYFGVIFNEATSYQNIVPGTSDVAKTPGLNCVFRVNIRVHDLWLAIVDEVRAFLAINPLKEHQFS
jgi:hypothetical protein